MTHVLVTVTGGIIERVSFFDNKTLALTVLAHFVKRMNPEEDDAAVFSPRGLVANAKDFLDDNDQFSDGDKNGDKPITVEG